MELKGLAVDPGAGGAARVDLQVLVRARAARVGQARAARRASCPAASRSGCRRAWTQVVSGADLGVG